MDHAKLLGVLTSLPVSHAILARVVSCALQRHVRKTMRHVIISAVDRHLCQSEYVYLYIILLMTRYITPRRATSYDKREVSDVKFLKKKDYNDVAQWYFVKDKLNFTPILVEAGLPLILVLPFNCFNIYVLFDCIALKKGIQ